MNRNQFLKTAILGALSSLTVFTTGFKKKPKTIKIVFDDWKDIYNSKGSHIGLELTYKNKETGVSTTGWLGASIYSHYMIDKQKYRCRSTTIVNFEKRKNIHGEMIEFPSVREIELEKI